MGVLYMPEQEYKVSDIIAVEGTKEEVLQRAASVNYLADFSVAKTLIDEAKAKQLPPLPTDKFEIMPGKGARAIIDGMEVRVGSPKLLVEERIPVPISFAEKITSLSREGKTVMIVLSGRSLSGAIILSDAPQSAEARPLNPTKAKPVSALRKFLGSLFRQPN